VSFELPSFCLEYLIRAELKGQIRSPLRLQMRQVLQLRRQFRHDELIEPHALRRSFTFQRGVQGARQANHKAAALLRRGLGYQAETVAGL
jgi:hypothetical protein